MDNPGLPDALWSQIDGRLWHATDRAGLEGIVARREIKAGFGKRYTNSFCRNQGSVCLFDFGPQSEDVTGQFANWSGWFGHQQNSRVAIWLEIDRDMVQGCLQDASEARQAWKTAMNQKFIPGVEACHHGPIPISAVTGVLLIDQHNLSLIRLLGNIDQDSVGEAEAFEGTLPPYEENPIVAALSAARQRILNQGGNMVDSDRVSVFEIARHAAELVNRHGKAESRAADDGPAIISAEIGPAREFYVIREGNDIQILMAGKMAFRANLLPRWEKDSSKIEEHDESMALAKPWGRRFLDES